MSNTQQFGNNAMESNNCGMDEREWYIQSLFLLMRASNPEDKMNHLNQLIGFYDNYIVFLNNNSVNVDNSLSYTNNSSNEDINQSLTENISNNNVVEEVNTNNTVVEIVEEDPFASLEDFGRQYQSQVNRLTTSSPTNNSVTTNSTQRSWNVADDSDDEEDTPIQDNTNVTHVQDSSTDTPVQNNSNVTPSMSGIRVNVWGNPRSLLSSLSTSHVHDSTTNASLDVNNSDDDEEEADEEEEYESDGEVDTDYFSEALKAKNSDNKYLKLFIKAFEHIKKTRGLSHQCGNEYVYSMSNVTARLFFDNMVEKGINGKDKINFFYDNRTGLLTSKGRERIEHIIRSNDRVLVSSRKYFNHFIDRVVKNMR